MTVNELNDRNNGAPVRRVFCSKGNLLVLHDHAGGIRFDGAGNLSTASVGGVDFKDHLVSGGDDGKTEPIRMIAHIGGAREEVVEYLYDGGVNHQQQHQRKVIILQVSTQASVSEPFATPGNVVWLSMKDREAYKKVGDWLDQFLRLSFGDAAALAGCKVRADANGFEAGYSRFLDIIFPDSIDALFALRLLCGAYISAVIDAGEAAGEKSVAPVSCPVPPKEWFTLFDLSLPDDANQRGAVLERFANMMGAAKEQAKVLATAIAAGKEGKELRGPIEAFLGAGVAAPQQPAGNRGGQ